MNTVFDGLLKRYTRKYIDILSELPNGGVLSYGFEYEFLPDRILSPEDVQDVGHLLMDLGLVSTGDIYQAENGLQVAFEPGGQIEFCSPPLLATETRRFKSLLSFICQINEIIQKRLGIQYIGTDYLPGRANAPLCLSGKRYIYLHDRLSHVDTRGLEMMKGTASIHLHVLISGMQEVLPLFNLLCELSRTEGFCMSRERRDIWNHTDTSRCGRPPCCFAGLDSSEVLIKRLVHFALHADVLGEDVVFAGSSDLSFEAFLNHMTTLFTDVRFNLKGPTLELRTMDSMPIEKFARQWEKFVSLFENYGAVRLQ